MEINNKTFQNSIDILKKDLDKYKDCFIKNKELVNEIKLINENHLKEISKYKELLKQKEIEIENIKIELINSKKSLETILELNKIITELKIENNQMLLKIQEYEKKKIDNYKFENQNILSFSFKEGNNKIQSAYQSLVQENEKLKDNILKLRQYHN